MKSLWRKVRVEKPVVELIDEEKRMASLLLSWITDWMISPNHIDCWTREEEASYIGRNFKFRYVAKNLSLSWIESLYDYDGSVSRVDYNGDNITSYCTSDPAFIEASRILRSHIFKELYPKDLVYFPRFNDEREIQVATMKSRREARLRATLAALAEAEMLERDFVLEADFEPALVPVKAIGFRHLSSLKLKGVDFPITAAVVFDHPEVFDHQIARSEITHWLSNNATKGWYVMRHYVVFEHEDDALLCRMSLG